MSMLRTPTESRRHLGQSAVWVGGVVSFLLVVRLCVLLMVVASLSSALLQGGLSRARSPPTLQRRLERYLAIEGEKGSGQLVGVYDADAAVSLGQVLGPKGLVAQVDTQHRDALRLHRLNLLRQTLLLPDLPICHDDAVSLAVRCSTAQHQRSVLE